jgi:hypothetical protein
MPKHPEPVRGLLKGHSFAALRARLDRQARILAAVHPLLPEALRAHCLHCVDKGERLILYVDSPAFAFPLRFHAPALVPHLQAQGFDFREIQVRNLLTAGTPAPADRPRPVPASPRIGELLLESAENAASDGLKEALSRLGRTVATAHRNRT